MHASKIFAIAAFGASNVLAQDAPDAPPVENQPEGKSFTATLPEEPFWTGALDGNVKGYVSAKTGPDGVGATFDVKFENLPKEGGPFTYHIHVDPVPEDGNCTSTLAHLDPFARGEDPACDSDKPETCQVGDLSGKWGKITTTEGTFEDSYHDPYVSVEEGIGAYFGNRSFVFHFANKTRISCANFVANGDGGNNGGGHSNGTYPTTVPTGGSPPPPSPTSDIPISAGSALNMVKNYGFAPLLALLFML